MIPRRIHIILPLLFGLFFFLLDYILSHYGPTPFTFRMILWALIQSTTIYLVMYTVLIGWRQKEPDRPYFKIHRIIGALLLAFVATLFMYLLFRFLYPDPDYALSNLQLQVVWILLIITIFESLMILFVLQTIVYFREKTRLKIREEHLKQESVKAQFELLKSEINPHFLFNNFNTLYGLIRENPKIASEFLLNFSQLFRYLMVTREQDTVALGEEIKMVRSYVYVLQNRYREQLMVEFNIPEKDHDYRIVPLAIQMLIENAIKHNQIDADHHLQVLITFQEGRISVWNNRWPKRYPEDPSGKGLNNLVNRYRYLSEESVMITEHEQSFEVSLPLIRASTNES